MANSVLAEVLERLTPEQRKEVLNEKTKPAARKQSKFTLANTALIADVLTWQGVEHNGEFATCFGCGEPGMSITHGNKAVCLHNRCATKGRSGARSAVEAVAEIKGIHLGEAAKLIVDHFKLRPTTEAGAFVLVDAEGIFAPLEEPDELVEGVMRRGSVNLLGGYGSSFKTWLAVLLMICVATGRKWLGRHACKQGLATILDYESGGYELRRRFQWLTAGMGLSGVIKGLDFATMPNLYMGTAEFEIEVEKLAKTRALIVLDSLRAATPGAEENDSGMRVGLDQLRRVAEHTGCVFVVLLHAKKTGPDKNAIDPRELLRGSSAIFDAADGAFVARYAKGKPLRIDQIKARHGRAVEPFEVVIVDQDGGGVTLEATDAIPEVLAGAAKDKFEATVSKVLAVIGANPGCSTRYIRAHVDGVRETVTTAVVEYLEDRGQIENRGDDKNTKWHTSSGAGAL